MTPEEITIKASGCSILCIGIGGGAAKYVEFQRSG